VIGGGISGLAAAVRLRELLPQAEAAVFEASERPGGVLQTVRRDGYLVERAADSFITNVPWAMDLCRRLGLTDSLLTTDSAHRRALVVHQGRLLRVPDGFLLMSPARLWPLLTTQVLSWPGKLRLMAEPLVRPRAPGSDQADESVESFATRRLGREAFERLVQPLVAGIYTADPAKLSMAATMGDFLVDEQQHGSLFRAAVTRAAKARRANKRDAAPDGESGARFGLFVTPRDGMASLVESLADRLPAGSLRLGARVTSLKKGEDGRWQVASSADETAQPFDAVILALPAYESARLVDELDAELSTQLDAIPYAGAAVVSFAYRRDQVSHPLDAFGMVVPQVEGRQIIAASFASVKFPGRAPADRVLIRTFVGGAMQPELAELPDERLWHMAHEELCQLLGITGQPLWNDVARWPRSMPQYHVGHVQRIAEIERRVAVWPGLELAGNACHGVGIPQCIRSGETAAERIAAWCSKRKPTS
jgi:oxygen-dependent protoporphyrinogen oxidase